MTVAPPGATDDPVESWGAALAGGDFARAWDISDASLRARLARGTPVEWAYGCIHHIWNGEPLAGRRVLVRCHHGLGDTIQFIRFAAPLRRVAREVIVWVQPKLLPLIGSAPGVDRALPLEDGEPRVAHDVAIEAMELAHSLRADAAMVQCPVPYLRLSPAGEKRQRQGVGKRAVGVVWRGGDWAPTRSLPAALLAPLARLPGIELYSLQCGGAAAEAAQIPAVDIATDDVMETAARLRGLDLLITVDTFVAHLAGALGVPVCLLLQAQCDWRWGRSGDTSLWYPTMRLFRQRRQGDWHSVIDAVAARLMQRTMQESGCLP